MPPTPTPTLTVQRALTGFCGDLARAPHQLSAAESAAKWKEEVAISDRLAASHHDTAPATTPDTTPTTVNAWWQVNYSAEPLVCERATTSPADSYSREEFSDRQAGMSVGPRIIDNGDEVTVKKPPLAGLDISETFYRTPQACQAFLTARDERLAAQQKKFDTYR